MRFEAAFAVFAVLLAQAGRAPAEQVYTDVTAEMGISVPGLGSGTAWSDLDGDGDLDLLVSTSTYPDHIHLYRNDGSVFTDVHASSGLTNEARNFAVGDYDGDGLDDIALISFGYVPHKLYRNLGGMQFEDRSDTAGIFGDYAWRCAFVDYDDDGLLDLHFCGSDNGLFRNLGDGTFEEVSASSGFETGGRSCAWLDYDNDGLEDCYVGRSGSGNLLYRNLGDGTFEEVGAAAGVADDGGTSGVCAGDYDGDGFFDLYSVNINSPSNRLFRNQGDGTFEDVTVTAGVGDVGDGRTATFLDIDQDGLVDIFSVNHVYPNRVYRNNGDGTFTDIAPALNITDPEDAFGTGFADYDGDGDIDAFLATHFGNRLLRCDGMENHWLVLQLTGTVSNRSAIGTSVRCSCAGDTVYARVDGGHGMGDYDSRALEFGLGSSGAPADIEIRWPSGIVESYSGVGPDVYLDIIEDQGLGTGHGQGPVRVPLSLRTFPNPASDLVTVSCSLGGDGGEAVASLLDLSGRLVLITAQTFEGGTVSLDLSVGDLQPGLYLLTVRAGGSAETGMVVIAR
ncbi:MAG: hypothetical protein AVO35_06230 [Candidatus Aegiribacteria sp. MLS_C]|nr:MAG: hypothetical protein AVO35_06230 [Candidatus Aegiribacteria sp. MLS_C]